MKFNVYTHIDSTKALKKTFKYFRQLSSYEYENPAYSLQPNIFLYMFSISQRIITDTAPYTLKSFTGSV